MKSEARSRHAVARTRSTVTHRRERRLDRVGCAQVLPVFGREFVESQQALPILLQRIRGLRVFRCINRYEPIECGVGVGARGSHPDGLQISLGAALLRLRQRIEHFPLLVKLIPTSE